MRKIYFLIILAFLVGFLPPNLSRAAETDLYADAVYSASNQVYQPSNSLEAPDGIYTEFWEEDTTLTLDLGEGEEGTGDLTLYFNVLNFGAGYRVEFLTTDLIKVQTTGNTLPLSSELTIAYVGGVPYRYVAITSLEDEQWRLDAIMVASINEAPEEEIIIDGEENLSEEMTEEEMREFLNDFVEGFTDMVSDWFSCGDNQGLIVKRPDDGNSVTDADSIVYTIGCDNTLHIFPDEQTFKTWWTDFDSISYINGAFLASHELGNNVTIRPGTYLVKQASDPKVYAVEPEGVLRWIPDETTAQTLYGENWNARVIDIPEAIFSDYTLGEDLTTEAYPTGTIGYLPTGEVVYLDGNYYYTFVNGLNAGRFQSKFLVDLDDNVMTNYYSDGGLNEDSSILYPF
ncbi:MAG: hypothetical protein V1664_02965 [Candidatus Uhrbacteria bacterium]